jgi:hypothetical protein
MAQRLRNGKEILTGESKRFPAYLNTVALPLRRCGFA